MGRRRGAGRFVLVLAFGCSTSTGSDDEGGTSAPTTAPTMTTASTSADGTTTAAANCPLGPAPAITAGGSYATTGCGGSGDCEVPPALLEPGCPVD